MRTTRQVLEPRRRNSSSPSIHLLAGPTCKCSDHANSETDDERVSDAPLHRSPPRSRWATGGRPLAESNTLFPLVSVTTVGRPASAAVHGASPLVTGGGDPAEPRRRRHGARWLISANPWCGSGSVRYRTHAVPRAGGRTPRRRRGGSQRGACRRAASRLFERSGAGQRPSRANGCICLSGGVTVRGRGSCVMPKRSRSKPDLVVALCDDLQSKPIDG